MDGLLARQGAIEAGLTRCHLSDGTLALYDLTVTHCEGRTGPLTKRGYARDAKRDRRQTEFGLLCDGGLSGGGGGLRGP